MAISQIYKSHPDRLRDWVNHPKANGYQALHVTLMSSKGRWIEVQIRSEHMNELAEQGFAAHWKYKDGGEITEDEGELNEWLSTIKGNPRRPTARCYGLLRCHQTQPLCL